jgi:hypothetical protein
MSHPGAKSWKDLGIQDFYVPSYGWPLSTLTMGARDSTPRPFLQPAYTPRSLIDTNLVLVHELSDEDHSLKAPAGYTSGMQDPKHHSQMLRSPLEATWLAAQRPRCGWSRP